jgi:hypothetical protein
MRFCDVEALGLIVGVLVIVEFFFLCSRVAKIEKLVSLLNQKLGSQTGVLERCARVLEASAGKLDAVPPSSPAEESLGPRDKGLSLGGYNR